MKTMENRAVENRKDSAALRKLRLAASLLSKEFEEKKAEIERAKKQLREAEVTLRSLEGKEARKALTRVKAHAGGMMKMVGLLEYRFFNSDERDNDQDDLRANLLVGALLFLADKMMGLREDELEKLESRGAQYRAQNPKDRVVPSVNPLVILG
jgi:hypothetical protein